MLNINPIQQQQLWQQQLITKDSNSIDNNKRNSSNIFKQQLAILQNLPNCYLSPSFVDNIAIDRIKTLLTKQFYNANLLKVLACSCQLIATLNNNLDNIIKVHQWFTDPISNGNIITTKWDDSDDNSFFIIKSPKDADSKENINELFVGIFGTNELRKFVPNFAYIYTGFQCSNPIVDISTNKVVNWCMTGQTSYYIVYENIEPSTSLELQSKSMTFDYFLLYYLQILLALRKALAVCNFTHYDLHAGNVLLRQLPTLVAIEYETFYGKRYIHSDKIATIIDYEYSFINYDNKGYTDIDKPGSQMQAFILGDAHKLLCSVMYINFNTNKALFTKCINILKFFTPIRDDMAMVDSIDYLNDLRFNYFQLIPTVELNKVGVDELINHILPLTTNPILFTQAQTKNIINCDYNNICLSENDVIKSITNPDLALSIESFYDRLFLDNKDKLIQSTDVLTLVQKAIVDYNNLIINIDIDNLLIIKLVNNKNLIFNYQFLLSYIYYITKLLNIISKIEIAQAKYNIINSIISMLNLNITIPINNCDNYQFKLKPYIDLVLDDVGWIKTVIVSDDYKNVISLDYKFIWLERVLANLDKVLPNF